MVVRPESYVTIQLLLWSMIRGFTTIPLELYLTHMSPIVATYLLFFCCFCHSNNECLHCRASWFERTDCFILCRGTARVCCIRCLDGINGKPCNGAAGKNPRRTATCCLWDWRAPAAYTYTYAYTAVEFILLLPSHPLRTRHH